MTMYDRIRKLRTDQKMSQEDLAHKVGYKGRSMIARIESGQVDISQSKIKAFANALNTTIDYLMDDAPVRTEYLPIHEDIVLYEADKDDEELCRLWKNASPEAKKAALAVLKSMEETGRSKR